LQSEGGMGASFTIILNLLRGKFSHLLKASPFWRQVNLHRRKTTDGAHAIGSGTNRRAAGASPVSAAIDDQPISSPYL
jgi:hypothetical protein